MATPNSRTVRSSRRGSPSGEPLVWLSSVGLAVALMMLVGLLSLIVWEGIRVFWPKQVAEITLQTESGSEVIAGAVVKRQANPKQDFEEWQLFTGNKDVYGSMFRYIDATSIRSVRYPESIAVAERVEYGNAIFHPLSLKTAEGLEASVDEPDFMILLESAILDVRERYRAIADLERNRIGALNTEVNNLTIERRNLNRRVAGGDPVDPERLAFINQRLEILQEQFTVLAAEARALRDLQEAGHLEYRLPTGEVRREALGNILGIHLPNTMGILEKTAHFLSSGWAFLSERPREANTEGGIFPAIFGTFVLTILMTIAVMPMGVIAAIYLREYAHQGPMVRIMRISVNNLAGVPSIVYGVFGLGFFVYFIGGSVDQLFFSDRLPTATFGTGGILWASLTLALMTVPVVIVATEEAFAAIPVGAREASLACGATRWQTVYRIILPASAPGIMTGLILAMARGAGEVAPLMMVGVVKLAPSLPIDGEFPFVHLERKFMHLGFHIYDLGFQSPDSEAARPMVFATTFLLIILVIVLNLGAILIRNRLRQKYKTATF